MSYLLFGVIGGKEENLADYRTMFGFLYSGFNTYYWELTIVLRKTLFSVIAVALRPSGADVQTLTGILVIVIAAIFHTHVKPYHSSRLNVLEGYALFTAFVTLLSGMYLFSPNVAEDARIACSFVIVLCNILLLLIIVWQGKLDSV